MLSRGTLRITLGVGLLVTITAWLVLRSKLSANSTSTNTKLRVPVQVPTAASLTEKTRSTESPDDNKAEGQSASQQGRALAGTFELVKGPHDNFRGLTVGEAELLLQKHLSTMTGHCTKRMRFGRKGDGGYDICMDEPYAPAKNSCLVYSFGIRNEWSFDDDVAKRLGCEVHCFDPSMNKPDHRRSDKIWFHDLGIWGSDLVNEQGWSLKSLSSIIQHLGHTDRTIDYLKIDVEGAEWPTLQEMLANNSTDNVKQMIFEIHTPKFKDNPMTLDDYAQVFTDLTALQQQLGFRLYNEKHVNGCCGRFSRLTPGRPGKLPNCCYELFYVNEKTLEKTSENR